MHGQVLVALADARAQAVRLSEIAESAFSSVAALEQFVDSAYFSVDAVALRDLAGDDSDRITTLVDIVKQTRKAIDKYNVLEIVRLSNELHGIVDAALRVELRESEVLQAAQ